MLRQFAFRRFMLGEHLACPRDYFIRQACQLGHFDAIAAVSRSRLDFAQEDDAASGFLYRDVIVLYPGKLFG